MVLRPLRWATLILAAGIAACAGQRDPFERNSAPANYKADILAFLRTYLNDPTNLREAAVTPPSLQRVGRDERYAACVRFNARRSDGKYAGLLDTAAVFNTSGKLDRFIDLTPDETAADAAIREQLRDVCKTAAYQPFPELERLTR
ncbi:MAG: hypothetical protein GEU91_16180 [Rhizobiales bacterium]|nr:hypothetical protein [Hyphomicrobiales bacterium]